MGFIVTASYMHLDHIHGLLLLPPTDLLSLLIYPLTPTFPELFYVLFSFLFGDPMTLIRAA